MIQMAGDYLLRQLQFTVAQGKRIGHPKHLDKSRMSLIMHCGHDLNGHVGLDLVMATLWP